MEAADSAELQRQIRELRKENRNVTSHLKALVKTVEEYLERLDQVMTAPSSANRGEKVAALANALTMQKDQARFFGLDIDFRTGKKRKKAKAKTKPVRAAAGSNPARPSGLGGA